MSVACPEMAELQLNNGTGSLRHAVNVLIPEDSRNVVDSE